MSRAVLVSKQLPWPSDSGGRLREAGMVEMFRTLYDDVHVVGHGAPPDRESVPDGVTVHGFGSSDVVRGTARAGSVVIGRWYSVAMARTVAALLTPRAHLHVGFPHMAVVAPSVDRIDSLDLHNVESDLLAQRARTRSRAERVVLAGEVRRMRAWERRLAAVPIVSCVSENDRTRLRQLGVDALVAPNGSFLPNGELHAPSGDLVLFVGALDWEPNAEGVRWFAHEVWPLVRASRRGARAVIAGRHPGPGVTGLTSPDLEVRGNVPSVVPLYAESAVAVCPLLTGGGSRLKIIEALAHGRPVVSTRLGAEGLEQLEGRGIVLADTPHEFAAALTSLLDDPTETARLGDLGRRAVAEGWSWQAVLEPLRRRIAERGAP